MNDRVTVEIHDGVADVRLSRPDKMNALDPAMFEAIERAGTSLQTQPGLRAVVLSGEGKAFCAGLDMSNFGDMAEGKHHRVGKLAPRTHGDANAAQYLIHVWRNLPVPVIAAVHGVALGGGFQLTLGADIRIVAPDTKLSVMEIKWGLVPDMGGFPLMRLYARDDVVRELTYTGRIFSGEEALSLGFATRLSDNPRAEALAMAAAIAQKNPHAIRGAKRLCNLAAEGSAAELLMAESVEQEMLIGKPNQVEAIMANLQKRAASFVD